MLKTCVGAGTVGFSKKGEGSFVKNSSTLSSELYFISYIGNWA